MAARQQRDRAFSIGDRVSHREHGDGTVKGTYGSTKLSVNFDNSHTKRMPPESLTLAAPMSSEELETLLRERDARRAKARAEFERKFCQPKCEPPVSTSPPTLDVFTEDDFQLASFDWKLVPPGSPFWSRWNDDKSGMKACGYRVTKDARDWLVSKEAVQAPPVSESNHSTAQIIQFTASRLVRHLRNGQPIADAAGNEAA
jgi:hypothetical protein